MTQTRNRHINETKIQTTRAIRASPTHNTIIVSKPHYFSVISALKKSSSPTITPNHYNTKIILFELNFRNHYNTKIILFELNFRFKNPKTATTLSVQKKHKQTINGFKTLISF